MDQYSVPQFVDRETRILGALTIKQVAMLGTAAVILFILHYFLNFLLLTIAIIIIGGLALALAFGEISGRPLYQLFFSFLGHFLQPRVYLWTRNKEDKTEAVQAEKQEIPAEPVAPKEEIKQAPTEEQIKNLAEILNK